MAAAKMLTQMLRSDNIPYAVRAVSNFDDVIFTIQNNITPDIKTVFMINCGAIYDIPKYFNLEHGSDLRCYILDNHRPIHLKNIYSRHSVVVFDEADANEVEDDLPSEASEMASDVGDNEMDLESSDEELDEEDDEELDEEDGEGKDRGVLGDEDDEFDATANDITRDEEYDFNAEENADSRLDEQEENVQNEQEVDDDVSEEKQKRSPDSLVDSDDENDFLSQPQKKKGLKTRTLQADEDVEAVEEESMNEEDDEQDHGDDVDEEDVDKTFIAPYMKTEHSSDYDDEENVEDIEEGADVEEHEMQEDVEDEESFRMIGRKRKRIVNPGRVKRQRIQQYYCKAITYNSPTALMLLPFVKARIGAHGHMPLDITWQAILGITDQYMKGRLNEDQYEACCQYLKIELGEHLVSAADRVAYTVPAEAAAPSSTAAVTTVAAGSNPSVPLAALSSVTAVSIAGAQSGHIQETAEYRFFLHRHWPLYESMIHSSYIASRFTIWNSRGTAKLQELLAEMGVPLQQCRQQFSFMTPEIRQHFRAQIKDPVIQEKYKLADPDCTYKSFCRFTSYKNPIAAEDVVQAATALLELYGKQKIYALTGNDGKETFTTSLAGGKENIPPTIAGEVATKDTFVDAYALLGTRNDPLVKKGIALALEIQQAILKKASAMLDGQDSIHRYHRIYYAYIRNNLAQHPSMSHGSFTTSSSVASVDMEKELTSELIFGRPMVLNRLGQFLMEVKRNQSKKEGGWTGSSLLPLILLSERQDGSYLVMGISPFATTTGERHVSEEHVHRLRPLTNFRQFFKLAAKDMHIKYRFNSFDPNVVEIAKEDTQDFLGALDNALKKATPNFFARV
jgi:cell division control protein 45